MNPQFNVIVQEISVWLLPILIAVTFHEAAHGFVAHLLGDNTAWRLGRVSFNPLKHIDPFGTLILPAMLLLDGGKPLDGANKYTIHFEKGATPPANAFWSITLYDSDGFQVANALNRFAVSSYMPFKFNADGSLDIYLQNESPGKDKEANWLPAPKAPFNVNLRIYSPRAEAINGKWNPPPIMKAQ